MNLIIGFNFTILILQNNFINNSSLLMKSPFCSRTMHAFIALRLLLKNLSSTHDFLTLKCHKNAIKTNFSVNFKDDKLRKLCQNLSKFTSHQIMFFLPFISGFFSFYKLKSIRIVSYHCVNIIIFLLCYLVFSPIPNEVDFINTITLHKVTTQLRTIICGSYK